MLLTKSFVLLYKDKDLTLISMILGTFIPPDLTTVVHSSSTTTEKISKFSSQSSSTTSQSIAAPFTPAPIQEAPIVLTPGPAPIFMQSPVAQAPAPAPAPIQKPQTPIPVQKPQTPVPAPTFEPDSCFLQKPQNQPPKPVQNTVPKSFPPPKSPIHFNQQQQQPAKSPIPAPQTHQFQPKVIGTAPSPKMRAGLNASPVTPGILKKQMQVDAAVPRMPGAASPQVAKTPIPAAKSPVPFLNTTPSPFGLQNAGIQTPDTLAQLAPISPAPASLPRNMQTPKPLPLIVSTPIPKYTNNYNLAAAGFGVQKDSIYRSIIMDGSKKLVPPVVYTDF